MRCTALLLGFTLVACGGKTFEDVGGSPDATPSDSATVDSGAVIDGAPEDLTRCTGPGTCSLVPTTCCGTCSEPTTTNMTAVTKGREGEHTRNVCGPDPVGCPACAPVIPDGSIQAWCMESRCKAIDVRTESVSACATDADCMLRYQSCCEPCEERPYELVAINISSTSAYRAKVCVGDETCSKCASRYPAGARAYCDKTTKHCKVTSPF